MGLDKSAIASDRVPLKNLNVVCSICTDILVDPVDLLDCQHTFCKQCIAQWIEGKRNRTGRSGNLNVPCPDCRRPIKNRKDVVQAHRFIRNTLSEMEFKCSHCENTFGYGQYRNHVEECEDNPVNFVKCACEFTLKKSELGSHQENCLPHWKKKFAVRMNLCYIYFFDFRNEKRESKFAYKAKRTINCVL